MSIFDPSAYAFSWYALPPLGAAALLCTLACVMLIRERWSPVSLTFSLLVLSGIIWLAAYGGIFSSRDAATAMTWIYIENCGVVLIPSQVLLFALVTTQKLYRYRVLLWSGYALSYGFLLLTPFTDWLVAGAYQYPWGWYMKYGPLGKWFYVFFAVMMSASLHLFWQEFRRAQSLTRRRRFAQLFAALALVQLASVDALAAFGFSVYPFGYMFVLIFVLLMARVLWQYRLTDITPAIAADEILQTMTEGLVVLDREGSVRIANPAACRLLGLPEKKVRGARLWKLDQPVVDEKWFNDFLLGKAAQGYEVCCRKGKGREVILSVAVSAIRDATDVPEAVVLVLRDITKQKKAQEILERSHAELEEMVRARTAELEEANRQLREMDEKKTQFLALASHELKTPLTAIHGFLSILLEGHAGEIPPRQKECLEIMKSSNDRLHRLVLDLLDLSKIEFGQFQMKAKEEDLKPILEEELTLLREEIRRKELMFECEIEDGVRPVLCDRERIREVFVNLLSNALKYTPRQGKMRVSLCGLGDGVEVAVEDNGIGIKAEDQKRIFEPFQHLRKSGLEGEVSTGLGLVLVKKVAEAHGGRVTLQSEEGRGSRFAVFIPYAAGNGKAKAA